MAVVVCHRDDEGFQRWLDEHPDGNRFCVVQKPDRGKKPLRPDFLEPPFHALLGWVLASRARLLEGKIDPIKDKQKEGHTQR